MDDLVTVCGVTGQRGKRHHRHIITTTSHTKRAVARLLRDGFAEAAIGECLRGLVVDSRAELGDERLALYVKVGRVGMVTLTPLDFDSEARSTPVARPAAPRHRRSNAR